MAIKSKRQLGGIKAAAKLKRERGADFYAKLGKKGGSAKKTKPHGFMLGKGRLSATERARRAGAKGGTISKRGKALKEVKND